ncbi:hypothetical protein Tco_0263047, partial [Tanacetum coccineum]
TSSSSLTSDNVAFLSQAKTPSSKHKPSITTQEVIVLIPLPLPKQHQLLLLVLLMKLLRNELDALALKHLGPVPTTVSTSTNPVNTGSINLNTAFEEVNTDNTEAISPSADHEEEVFSDADDDEMPEIRIYDKSSEGIFEKASCLSCLD